MPMVRWYHYYSHFSSYEIEARGGYLPHSIQQVRGGAAGENLEAQLYSLTLEVRHARITSPGSVLI